MELTAVGNSPSPQDTSGVSFGVVKKVARDALFVFFPHHAIRRIMPGTFDDVSIVVRIDDSPGRMHL